MREIIFCFYEGGESGFSSQEPATSATALRTQSERGEPTRSCVVCMLIRVVFPSHPYILAAIFVHHCGL